ncbi:phenylacetic acid degradation operon negative regulatory protein PaaX [Polycladomyces abyssicola]|uniref:Phenylacetic acid degradation operon negative regulatory protein PaaX n=1 Tax=Polycladomyces abyssicola TaxID=1125966 RepID=A0A8D5UCH7_9BACL|nr:PaaX family transcriptional regulator C-terminal domain-containing protein [Polycladomyces abyssicola]BCU80585.1 phenylacetic acid degradation operon negative regulatory protein PaaX [Polycladomyces abyssicola]
MRPRSLMFTLYGDYIQYYGEEIWIGSLIRLMGEFGISEQSVRGATMRMVNQDLLKVRRIGNKSYYSLTDKGKRNIEDGVRRVYSIKNHKWDRLWRVLTYSIPEEKRELRTQIRKELTWLGFGLISNSTWISPNPLEEKVMDMVREYHLEPYVFFFQTDSIVSHENEDIITRGWDLEKIENEYKQFIQYCEARYEEIKQAIYSGTLSNRECFKERTILVHEYRKFLFKDPGFPLDLLPQKWSGIKARELFWKIHQLVSNGAVQFFEECYQPAPDNEVLPNREGAINPFLGINVHV